NRPKERKKRFERLQGDPRMIRSPHTDSDFFRPRNPPPPVAPQNVESCCIWDSVQSVEQPWPIPVAGQQAPFSVQLSQCRPATRILYHRLNSSSPPMGQFEGQARSTKEPNRATRA